MSVTISEDGRGVSITCLVTVGSKSEGHHEPLRSELVITPNGAGWLAFCHSLVARGFTGVQVVVAHDHAGPVHSIAATFPDAGP